jgi:hypothetical protein
VSFSRGTFWRFFTVTAIVAVGTWYFWPDHPSQTTEETPQPVATPLPPYTESRYLNTHPSARFIGNAACATCHEKNYQSYSLTAHSRALSDIDPDKEPPDGSFTHQASGRTYRIYRKNGQLHHQEVLSTDDGKEIARVDLPLRYRIGSGQHARAYAVEVDGFLHQSPLAWYETKQKWDMSPGYDIANHGSFERPIEMECMACHSGHTEEVGGTLNRLNIIEKAIGCESCHGPGSLHQDLHRSSKPVVGEEDLSIVNPRRLSRPLLESICSSCHLGDPAIVPLRGRQIGDFQPGRPLSDFRIHYRMEGSSDSMTVVGHVDQMHQSACYQKSPTMSCLTCHDPHRRELPVDRVAFFREKCLTCHNSHPCTLDLKERLLKDPQDNCMSCHMPRSKTEVPHVSFTHHRIGLHSQPRSSGPQRIPELVSTSDLSHLSILDRERSLGLAYQIACRKPEYAPYLNEFRSRERIHLEAAYEGGVRDAKTLIGLAELYWRGNRNRAIELAREGLAAKDISVKERLRALMVIAYTDSLNLNDAEAQAELEELIQKRRLADDWRRLGEIYLRQHAPDKASLALNKALEILPYRSSSHANLAQAYDLLGKTQLADEHREKAKWLLLHHQD